jgi:hypothetical protein
VRKNVERDVVFSAVELTSFRDKKEVYAEGVDIRVVVDAAAAEPSAAGWSCPANRFTCKTLKSLERVG